MNANELLLEVLQLSKYTANTQHTIYNTLTKTGNGVFDMHHDLFNQEDGNAQFQKILRAAVKDALEQALMTIGQSITNHPVEVNLIKFDTELDDNGNQKKDTAMGQYIYPSTVNMTIDFVGKLVNAMSLAYSQKELGPSKRTGKYTDIKPIMIANINDVVHTFLHEIAHVIQLTNAGSDDLARSYITHDQIEVYLAKLNLAIQRNRDIYLGQPEEIAAYAQQFVIRSLAPYINQPPVKQRAFISALLPKIAEKAVTHEYTQYSENPDKRYIIMYRRFLKKVYLELQAYLEDLDRATM